MGGELGSVVIPCGFHRGHPGWELCPSPFCVPSAGPRARVLLAPGVLPAHQPPPARHPEAGPNPHGEPGALGMLAWEWGRVLCLVAHGRSAPGTGGFLAQFGGFWH